MKPAPALIFVEDFRAGDIRRHQVGGELNPLELEVQDPGERLDEQRFGQAGHTGNQAVPAGKQRDQDFFDHLVLADDDFSQFGENLLAALRDLLRDDSSIHVVCGARISASASRRFR